MKSATVARTDEPLLRVQGLRTYFDTKEGLVRAVDGVGFEVRAGETLGIVGESGSGKSVTAMSIMKLLQWPGRIVSGEILFRGRDILRMDRGEIRSLRGSSIAMVFQDPMTSLNPVLRISTQLMEAMLVHGKISRDAARTRAVEILKRMGISEPERALDSFPHQFSGGMRQRVMLAMSFSNKPSLLIADEPTTALDVTIQAQILDLLRELNTDFGTAVVLISHDLGVVANLCSRIVVMYAGEVVEEGTTEELLRNPRHPYTWALINAAPRLDSAATGNRRLTTIEGTPPDPTNWPPGCRFAPRCPFKRSQCEEHPALISLSPGQLSRCWVTQSGESLPDRRLLATSSARPLKPDDAYTGRPILELRGLVKHFPLPKDTLFATPKVVHALDGIDLVVHRGETIGLVGESGCGKSTLARCVVRIHEPTAGEIVFDGQEIGHASRASIQPLRRRLQMIFQDPYSSLNGRMKVGQILAEPIRFHRIADNDRETRERVEELLSLVGLGNRALNKYPHEFSGGQRQRISIARALAVEPDLVIADEPISALDVNIQAQILNLLVELQERLKLTYVFIAHDLAVVRHISDRIVVLYLGKIVEIAPAAELFDNPRHPYTKSLISAVPVPDVDLERRRSRIHLQGEPPSPLAPPSGCRFRMRCAKATQRCATEEPALRDFGGGQQVACHFPEGT